LKELKRNPFSEIGGSAEMTSNDFDLMFKMFLFAKTANYTHKGRDWRVLKLTGRFDEPGTKWIVQKFVNVEEETQID
jgi:hypothetical protein